jgi:hypothetical protein
MNVIAWQIFNLAMFMTETKILTGQPGNEDLPNRHLSSKRGDLSQGTRFIVNSNYGR